MSERLLATFSGTCVKSKTSNITNLTLDLSIGIMHRSPAESWHSSYMWGSALAKKPHQKSPVIQKYIPKYRVMLVLQRLSPNWHLENLNWVSTEITCYPLTISNFHWSIVWYNFIWSQLNRLKQCFHSSPIISNILLCYVKSHFVTLYHVYLVWQNVTLFLGWTAFGRLVIFFLNFS